MKLKSFLVLGLATLMLFGSVSTALGAEKVVGRRPVKQEDIQEEQITYRAVSGKVKEITKSDFAKDVEKVFIELEDGNVAYLVISKDTHIMEDKEIKVGSYVTGFFNANAPMIMIWPPQYSVDIIVVDQELANYKPFTGTVKEITKTSGKNGYTKVNVEDEKGMVANFTIADSTVVVDEKEITKGANITAFYNANIMTMAIYPPQYGAKVVIVNEDGEDSKEEKEKKEKEKKEKKEKEKEQQKKEKERQQELKELKKELQELLKDFHAVLKSMDINWNPMQIFNVLFQVLSLNH